MNDAPAPPRKPSHWSRRAVSRATGKAVVTGGILALLLLVAAPEVHTTCMVCVLMSSEPPDGTAPFMTSGGPHDVDVVFAHGELRCYCRRHLSAAGWYAVATGSALPPNGPTVWDLMNPRQPSPVRLRQSRGGSR